MTTALMTLNLKAEHQTYRCADGEKVPGVTTICNVFAKEALLGWYASEEREGILQFMDSPGVELRPGLASWTWRAQDLRPTLPQDADGRPIWFATTKRDKAADLGTVAHAMIEAQQKGLDLSPAGIPPEMYEAAQEPRDRYFHWVAMEKLTLVTCEHQMVSEAWRVGGTLDSVYRSEDDGLLELWDTKTSKPWYKGVPYDEIFAQTAAYAEMYRETTGQEIARIRIARVGKTAGDEGNLYPVTDQQRGLGLLIFQAGLSAYRAKQGLATASKR